MKLRNVAQLKDILLFTLIIIFLGSCLKDNFDFSDRIRYNPTFVMPLAHGNLSLYNMLKPNSDQIHADPDNLISIVMRQDSLFTLSLGDALEIPLPDSLEHSFGVNSVRMNDLNTGAVMDLQELLNRLNEPEKSTINGAAGKSAVFPAIPEQNIGELSAGKIGDIEYVHFSSGKLELTVTNNLQVDISIEVRLVNLPCLTGAGEFHFRDIGPGQSVTLVSDMEELLIRQEMFLDILAFSTASSNNAVDVDMSDDIVFQIDMTDLRALKGKARIEKTVIDAGQDILIFNFEKDIELVELNMERAVVNYSIDNSANGVEIEVDLVNFRHNGDGCGFNIIPDGSGGRKEGYEELSDIDFDIDDDVRIVIDYSLIAGTDENEMVEFDLSGGAIGLDLWFTDFSVGFARGYFDQGHFDFIVDELTLDLAFLKRISGDFRFSSPLARLFYRNSAGFPIELYLNINGQSTDGSRKGSLYDNGRQVFHIGYPEEPLDTYSGEIQIDRDNSNIVDFISIPPTTLEPDISVLVNPEGDRGKSNFITSKSSASMDIEFVLPLEVQLSDLILSDTMSIDFDPEDIDRFERLFFELKITNALPLGAEVSISLFDSLANQVLYTFDKTLVMESASVGEHGKVIEGSEISTDAQLEISGQIIDYLKQADNIIISARLNTGKNQDEAIPVKFLTTDKLDFKIILKAGIYIEY